MKEKEANQPDTDLRRTLDLLDAYPRQSASPWLADRVLATLKGAPAPRPVAVWQLTLVCTLLIANALAFYFWAANSSANDDPAYALGAEYGLVVPDEGADVYPIPSSEDY